MAYPILVTGAAGRVGGIGRTVVELRDMGAEVVARDLLDRADMHRAIAGCERMYFGMSVSDTYLA